MQGLPQSAIHFSMTNLWACQQSPVMTESRHGFPPMHTARNLTKHDRMSHSHCAGLTARDQHLASSSRQPQPHCSSRGAHAAAVQWDPCLTDTARVPGGLGRLGLQLPAPARCEPPGSSPGDSGPHAGPSAAAGTPSYLAHRTGLWGLHLTALGEPLGCSVRSLGTQPSSACCVWAVPAG